MVNPYRMKQVQKQKMSLAKKVAIAGSFSIVLSIVTILIIKMGSVEDSSASIGDIWTGAVSADWNNPKNWDGSSLPGHGASVTIPDSKNPPIVSDASKFTPGQIYVEAGGSLKIVADFDIKGDLILDEKSTCIARKGDFAIAGSIELLGAYAKFIVSGAVVKAKNLKLVSSDDSDSTYAKLTNGELTVSDSTTFVRDNSTGNPGVRVVAGSATFNKLLKTASGYDDGNYRFIVTGGETNFMEDFIMNGGKFKPTASGPCDKADDWNAKTAYKRANTERIYVAHKDVVYRMKPAKYWSQGEEPGSKKGNPIWEKVTCKDFCDLAKDWSSATTYKRSNGGDEVFVSYKGVLYELGTDVWWSQNNAPDQNPKYWTKLKQCSDYVEPSCGDVAQWNSATEYKRVNKSDVVEVFWDGKVYQMKSNKWYSQNNEPGANASIWQYVDDCPDSDNSGIARDSLYLNAGKVAFHKVWTRPAGFTCYNGATIHFKYKSQKLKLQKNDQYENLVIDSGVELDVEGNVFVSGELNVGGTCSGSSVIQLNGNSKQKITGGGSVAHITVNNTSDVELSDDLIITGALTLTEGDIELGDNDILLKGTTTHGNSNSYLKINGSGRVKAVVGSSPIVFPVGRNPYLPVVIDDGGGAEYSVGVVDKVFANPESESTELTSEAVSETWHIQASESKTNVSITIGWDPSQEMTSFGRSYCFVGHWEEGVSSAWSPLAYSAATGDGPYFKSFVLSSMSANRYFFGIGSGSSALPVEFIYFAVAPVQGKASLTWGTATEKNNDYFEIQRSADGVVWEPITQVNGFGNSINPIDYQAYDDRPLPGMSYYRLKQVDFDGTTDYSSVEQLNMDGAAGRIGIESTYPNPFSDQLAVRCQVPGAGLVLAELVSPAGSTVWQQEYEVFEGSQDIQLVGLSALQPGYYVLRLIQSGAVVTTKVLKG
jgi:hypothetical protein